MWMIVDIQCEHTLVNHGWTRTSLPLELCSWNRIVHAHIHHSKINHIKYILLQAYTREAK